MLILGINVQFTHHIPSIYQATQFLPPVSESSRGEGGSAGAEDQVPTFDGVFWEHFVTCLTTLTLHLVSLTPPPNID